MSNDDDSVGYKKPPKHTQFKPGQSGNPKGRPKGTKNLATDLSEELSEKIVVTEGGKQLKISKQRAMIKSLLAKALRGDTRAATVLLKLLIDAEQASTRNEIAEELSDDDQAILARFAERVIARSKKAKQEKFDDV
jgi:hypothetical protein